MIRSKVESGISVLIAKSHRQTWVEVQQEEREVKQRDARVEIKIGLVTEIKKWLMSELRQVLNLWFDQ